MSNSAHSDQWRGFESRAVRKLIKLRRGLDSNHAGEKKSGGTPPRIIPAPVTVNLPARIPTTRTVAPWLKQVKPLGSIGDLARTEA